MSTPDSFADIQKQMGQMQVEILREIGTVRKDSGDALALLTKSVSALEVRVASMESTVSETLELKARLTETEKALNELKTNFSTFTAQYEVRLETAEKATAFWRNIAASVAVAAILAVAGAFFTMYTASQQDDAPVIAPMSDSQVEELLREIRELKQEQDRLRDQQGG